MFDYSRHWNDIKDLLCINMRTKTIYGFDAPIKLAAKHYPRRQSFDLPDRVVYLGRQSGRKLCIYVILKNADIVRKLVWKDDMLLSETLLSRHPDFVYAFLIGADENGWSSLPYLELPKVTAWEKMRLVENGAKEENQPCIPAPKLLSLNRYVTSLKMPGLKIVKAQSNPLLETLDLHSVVTVSGSTAGRAGKLRCLHTSTSRTTAFA